MRKISAVILTIVILAVFLCPGGAFAASEDRTGFYLDIREGYAEGDTTFTADLHFCDENEYGIAYFGILMDYTPNAVLREADAIASGIYFGDSIVETPYMICGLASADDGFMFPADDTVIASFTFDIIDAGYYDPIQITLSVDPENGVGDMSGADYSDLVTLDGFTMEFDFSGDDPDIDDGGDTPTLPDFDDMYYKGSNKIYVNENFMNSASFTDDFDPGAFYIKDGFMYGWSEAKALQSKYVSTTYNGNTIFDNNSARTWLTFDMSITMTLGDDGSNNNNRFINLCYCNDNYMYNGYGSDRQFVSFCYDYANKCFRLGADGWNPGSMSTQLMSPVYRNDVPMDGSAFMNLGLSVGKDRIRCYYNGELIFDYYSTKFKFGDKVEAPFFLWNEGNVVKASNITIAEYGYLYGDDCNDVPGYVIGSDGFAVNYYGGDTTVVPNTVSKIGKFTFIKSFGIKSVFIPDSVTTIESGTFTGLTDLEIRCYEGAAAERFAKSAGVAYRLVLPGDANDDGTVSTTDVAALSRWLVGADVTVSYGADVDIDGAVAANDLAAVRRMIAG